MKRFSASLASRKMQIKTRKKYPTRIAKKKKKIVPSVDKEARNFGTARYW